MTLIHEGHEEHQEGNYLLLIIGYLILCIWIADDK